LKFKVITKHPVALDSIDHLFPEGTKQDNNKNPAFNEKLYKLFLPEVEIRIMDLGCSGGAFVKDCLDDGHAAIGLEGSDYSFNIKRAEWATIPDNLFTCDITKPFNVEMIYEYGLYGHGWFDIITSWELLEHIPEDRLPMLCENVRRHLPKKLGCYWIMSVHSMSYARDGNEYHATVKPREWWLEMFDSEGFRNRQDLVDYFAPDWVRVCPESFYFVLEEK
jgi:SAM-dependent methyltransferase